MYITLTTGALAFAPDRSWFNGYIIIGSLNNKAERHVYDIRGVVQSLCENCAYVYL